MLTIELRFLNGAFRAAEPSGRSTPEWPPAPDRVFQAFVAGAYEAGLMPRLRALLTALEEQPPIIACPPAALMRSPTVFVPTNFDGGHKRAARRFPAAYPRGDRVTYSWPIGWAAAGVHELAGAVTHVGRASSHVQATVLHEAPEPTWVPDPNGELLMRVPHAGRLEDLDEAYAINRRSPPAPLAGYREYTAVPARSAVWGAVILRQISARPGSYRAADVAEALRRAVLAHAGDQAPAALHGHGPERHVAFVALPDVGHAYATGSILGVAVWMPADISNADAQAVRNAVFAVDHIMLGGQRIELQRITDEPPIALRRSRWCRPARIWHTASPVVYEAFPRRSLTAEAIVARAAVNAGYPVPVAVAVSPFSTLAGSDPSRAFRLRRPGALYSHATIVFPEPVIGPVMLGRERHFGLGLCAPSSQEFSDGL